MTTSTKEQFIQDLINELNNINHHEVVYNENNPPINIPFIISAIDQQLDKCTEFLDDISKNKYSINGYHEDESGGYTNGKIRILIEKPDNEKESDLFVHTYCDYCYYIEFLYDERHWGYCECTPEDKGYNQKHHCCGINCDWDSSAFKIEKVVNLGYYSWKGQEKDYWEYKEKFEANEQNKNKEVEKFKSEEKKQNLINRINELQEELDKLELEELEKEKYKEFGKLKLIK